MRLRPTKGHVLIIPEEAGLKSDTLVIPEQARNKEMPEIGRIVAMAGKQITKKGVLVEPEFRIGNRVLVKKFTGLFVEFEGTKYFRVPYADVMAVL